MKPTLLLAALILTGCATPAPERPEEGVSALAACEYDVAAAPYDHAALAALVEAAAVSGQVPRAIALLQVREDPTALWYLGRLHWLRADTLPADPAAAQAELDTAVACFVRARLGNSTFDDGCERWEALCLGRKGIIAFAAGDIDHAETWLLQAVCARPDQVATDLGNGETIKLGLLRLGDRIMRDFARTEALFRAAATAVGNDLDLLNNAAVYARDLGTRLERAGRSADATEMYERSYATYLRAVELAPRDVRLRNDCALVAIHHLRCDRNRARDLLVSATDDGEAALRDAPPADPRRRQDLDEAIGDCYENLSLWHLQGGDAAAARATAELSLSHFPFEKRAGARRHLAAADEMLRGK